MGKRRRIACGLALVALLAVGGACSSHSKSGAPAKSAQAKAKAAKAQRARARALQRRRVTARRLAAQRRAAALRRSQAQLPPVTVPATVPTTVALATPASDLFAIQRTFTGLNAAFAQGVAAGIVSSNAANYWVASGFYTAAQCTKFEADRGGGVVSEAFVVHPETLQPAAGWVDPTVGRAPTGRIYSVSVDNVQTLVPTGEKRTQTAVMHASVNSLGVAHLFFRCA